MEKNLWQVVGNKCLKKAEELLNKETSISLDAEETVLMVERLVNIAIAIDTLNLHWEAQNRSGAGGTRDPLWGPWSKGNLFG